MLHPKVKVCPKCGATFHCTTGAGKCWCNKYHIPAAKLKFLKSNFDNCLCESCLKVYAVVKPKKV